MVVLRLVFRLSGLWFVWAFGAVFLPMTARAEYEGATFGVENYGGTGQCDQDHLTQCRNDASAVSDALDALGYEQTEYSIDSNVDSSDFADSALFPAWGLDETDPTGTDFADVIFFSGHGDRECSGGYHYSTIILGDSNGTNACAFRLDTNMRLSDSGGDADVMILAGCQTNQKCVWEGSGYDPLVWGSTQFDTLNGFHGLSWDNDTNTGWYSSYVAAAEVSGLGDDWLDWLTDAAWYYPEDQCATTVTWGHTTGDCDLIFDDAGFKDFKDTHPIYVSKYYHISPCDPEDGEAL